MIAIWMLRLLVATALTSLAARLVEDAASGLGWPRRWVWAGAFVLVVSLPWVGGLIPAPTLENVLFDRLAPTVIAEAPFPDGTALALAPPVRSDLRRAWFDNALLAGWAFASLVLALVFGHAVWRVRVIRRHGDAAVRVDGVDVIRSACLGPAAVGVVRPAIMLPRWVDELPEAERALIVSHEREHAEARDPLMLAAATLVVVAAPWCLPLWWMHRRLRDAAETDCDARVLARGVDRLAYGCALLRAARRPRGPVIHFAAPLLGGLDVTRLERRILMMTQQRPKHPVLRTVPLIAVAAIAGVIACDAASDTVGAAIEREADVAALAAERERTLVVRDALIRAGSCARSERDGSSPMQWLAAPGFCMVGAAAVDSLRIVGDPVIYVDGERVGYGGVPLSALDPAKIKRIEVVERAAVSRRARAEAANREPLISERGHFETVLPVEPGIIAPAAPARAAAVTERLHVRLRPVTSARPTAGGGPVFYLDGERLDDGDAALSELDPRTIERIDVLKGNHLALSTRDHAAGAVRIYTKSR